MSKGWIVILVCIGFIVVNAVVYAGSGRSTPEPSSTPNTAATIAAAVEATMVALPSATPLPTLAPDQTVVARANITGTMLAEERKERMTEVALRVVSTPVPLATGLRGPDQTATAQVASLATSQASTPAPPPSATPKPKTVGDVEVLSHTTYRNVFKWLVIDGEIQNTTTHPMHYVKVHATLFDDQGKVVRTGSAHTKLDIVPAGGRSPFSIDIVDSGAFVRYELVAEGEAVR